MIEITFEGQEVTKLSITMLGESFVGFYLTLKDGRHESLGYFRQES